MAEATSTRARIVYIIEWVLIALSLIGLLAAVIVYSVKFDKVVNEMIAQDPSISKENAEAALKLFIILIGVLGAFVILFEIGMNTVLTKGVSKRNHKLCKIWFVVQCVFLTLATIGMIIGIVNMIRGKESPYSLIGYIISFVYRVVTLVIIKQFMNELLESRSRTSGQVYHAT